MIIKKGVKMAGLQPQMQIALDFLEILQTNGLCILITSAVRDEETNTKVGGHPLSKHLTGHAIDVSKKMLAGAHTVAADIRANLKQHGFDVINEEDHIHIEYDPK